MSCFEMAFPKIGHFRSGITSLRSFAVRCGLSVPRAQKHFAVRCGGENRRRPRKPANGTSAIRSSCASPEFLFPTGGVQSDPWHHAPPRARSGTAGACVHMFATQREQQVQQHCQKGAHGVAGQDANQDGLLTRLYHVFTPEMGGHFCATTAHRTPGTSKMIVVAFAFPCCMIIHLFTRNPNSGSCPPKKATAKRKDAKDAPPSLSGCKILPERLTAGDLERLDLSSTNGRRAADQTP